MQAIEAARIPVVTEPGLCVMQIELVAKGVTLDTDRDAEQLAR